MRNGEAGISNEAPGKKFGRDIAILQRFLSR